MGQRKTKNRNNTNVTLSIANGRESIEMSFFDLPYEITIKPPFVILTTSCAENEANKSPDASCHIITF